MTLPNRVLVDLIDRILRKHRLLGIAGAIIGFRVVLDRVETLVK